MHIHANLQRFLGPHLAGSVISLTYAIYTVCIEELENLKYQIKQKNAEASKIIWIDSTVNQGVSLPTLYTKPSNKLIFLMQLG
jgi:hypothetical protein